MSRRIFFGAVLVLVSFIISSFRILFTGAVVGVGGFSLSLIAVMFFIGGIVLIFIEVRLESLVAEEGIVLPSEVMGEIGDMAKGDVAVVVDTSFLGSYKEKGVRDFLSRVGYEYGGAIVTDSVLKELRGDVRNLRDVVVKGSVMPSRDYKKYRGEAREYLESGRKAFYCDEVVPIILEEKKAPASRQEAAPYVVAVKKLMGYLAKSGKKLSRKNLVEVAKRHWSVSETDVDVLAVAIAEAKNGKDVVIAEKDVDFEDAVGQLRRVDFNLGSRICCVNCYKKDFSIV